MKLSADDHYKHRPEELEDVNMYDLFAKYTAKYLPRKMWASPVISPWRQLDLTQKEDASSVQRYCEQCLRLYKPWRKEEDLTGQRGADGADAALVGDDVGLYSDQRDDDDADADEKTDWFQLYR